MRILGRCALGALLVSLALASPASATFPGDNGRISFWRFVPEDDALSIFTTRSDGSDLTRVTDFGPGVFAVFSDWSPDGDRLAIDSDRSGSAQIWILNPDGSGARQLTGGPARRSIRRGLLTAGCWRLRAHSPGRTRGSSSFRRARGTGARYRRPGPPVTRVTDGGLIRAAGSPNGKWIAFTRFSVECSEASTFENCTTRIFRVRTNGKKLEQLTGPELNASAPDFHPSGRWIASTPTTTRRTERREHRRHAARRVGQARDHPRRETTSSTTRRSPPTGARWRSPAGRRTTPMVSADLGRAGDGRDPHQIVNSRQTTSPTGAAPAAATTTTATTATTTAATTTSTTATER